MPRGPIPKEPHELQRRNKDSQFTPLSGTGVKPPVARGMAEWCDEAKEWWRATKRNGVSRDYSESDWQTALRCVSLINDAAELRREGKYSQRRSLLAEVRQLEDRLLLTVRARRQARIAAGSPDEKPIETENGGEAEGKGGKVIPWKERLEAEG